MTTSATGTVLPPGTQPPTDTLPAAYEVVIDGFDESGLIRCVYPGGFVKHHQAETVAELAGKVTAVLRNRYGAGDVQFAAAPEALQEKQTFEVKGS